MTPSPRRSTRPGLSLLEVVVSLAILLFSVVALYQLVAMGSDRALDVRLPGMSGVELQRWLAELHCGLPIVFVTAHGDASLRDLVMKAGAAAFLNKPVRSDTLLREIHSAIEKSRTGEQP